MILDVEDADPLKMGEVLSFRPNYGAMLQGATSAYVEKCVLEEPSEL
jgi:predicted amino acid racemase